MNLASLPFNFRGYPEEDRYLLTNQVGSHVMLDRIQLNSLAHQKFDNISIGLRDQLLSLNFLSEEKEHAAKVNIIASRYASLIQQKLAKPSLFMVIPTLRCNHDCSYCQVSRAPINKKGVDQNVDNIDRIIAIIKAVDSSNIKIEFQGGEPLLALNYIKEFVVRAKQQLSHKKPTFVICTALAEIDEETLLWAKEEGVTFSVSLDGPEHLHNNNRPSRYFNAYQRVVENVKKIQTLIGPEYVSCLATVTKASLQFPREIAREYFNLGFNRIFIRPLSPFGFAYHLQKKIGYSAEEYGEFYKTLLDEVLVLNESRDFIDDLSLIHLKNIYQPWSSGYVDLQSPAGYLLGAMVFNYDGNVFGSDESRMLWEATKNPNLVMGTIQDDIKKILDHEPSSTILSGSFLACTPGCAECAYQPYCGSDPLFHLSSQGDYIGDKSVSFFCKLQRAIFDHLFHLIYDNYNANQVFDRWLSH